MTVNLATTFGDLTRSERPERPTGWAGLIEKQHGAEYLANLNESIRKRETKKLGAQKARGDPAHIKNDRTVGYARVQDGKRIFTISYRILPALPGNVANIAYAASVFRKENENETYARKKHVQTARGRLAVRPLYTSFEFTPEQQLILAGRDVPDDKEARTAWSKSEVGLKFNQEREAMWKALASFLRKEISKNGVRASQRLPRSRQVPH